MIMFKLPRAYGRHGVDLVIIQGRGEGSKIKIIYQINVYLVPIRIPPPKKNPENSFIYI